METKRDIKVERFLESMVLHLSLQQKKNEDELENTINSDLGLEEKIVKTQDILHRMAQLDGVIVKFNELTKVQNNNEEPEKPVE